MDKARQLRALARRLELAVERQDWSALGDADRELGVLLGALDGGSLSASERQALDVVRETHTAARLQCEGERLRLGAHLGELRLRKEGWLAYALDADVQERPL